MIDVEQTLRELRSLLIEAAVDATFKPDLQRRYNIFVEALAHAISPPPFEPALFNYLVLLVVRNAAGDADAFYQVCRDQSEEAAIGSFVRASLGKGWWVERVHISVLNQ